jgi:hypothetical protein
VQTSGLVLDVYDDTGGDVLRALFPTFDALPPVVKTAHSLSPDDRERLHDDAFALVLLSGEHKLRKYACVDAGHTLLSTAYFLANAHKLPAEAQKVAAANLHEACGWFGLEPPEALEKLALGVGTALTALTAVPTIKGTAQQVKGNLAATRALEGAGHNVVTPQMRAEVLKLGELSGTDAMPSSKATEAAKPPAKAVVAKTASVGHLVQGGHAPHPRSERGAAPENNEHVMHGPQPARPRVVDVTHAERPRRTVEKKATLCALGDRYPLDSYAQVKAASAYFDEYGVRLTPEDRRSFCLALVKRADALGIAVSHDARKYGAETYAPLEEIKIAHDARATLLADPSPARALLGALFEKRAELGPELFCAALAELDAAAGLSFHYDRDVPDPYYSTFGFAKRAAFREVIGNDVVDDDGLRRLAREQAKTLQETFSEEFLTAFQKDPVGIFESLPRDQKIVLMRMASDTVTGVPSGS